MGVSDAIVACFVVVMILLGLAGIGG